MKHHHLKSLVEFIVRRTFAEMGMTKEKEFEIESEDRLLLHKVELDNGQDISARVQMRGESESSGIGSYEYWGHRGHHKGTEQWSLHSWTPIEAWDENDQPIDLQNPANKPIYDAISTAVSYLQNEIEEEMNTSA